MLSCRLAQAQAQSVEDLQGMSIDQLANLSVTSVWASVLLGTLLPIATRYRFAVISRHKGRQRVAGQTLWRLLLEHSYIGMRDVMAGGLCGHDRESGAAWYYTTSAARSLDARAHAAAASSSNNSVSFCIIVPPSSSASTIVTARR
jgi:hypothetical protein